MFAAGRSHELKIAYPTSQSLDRFWLEHEQLDSQEKRHAAALILLVKSFGQLDNQIMMCWRKKCGQSITTGNCQILNQNRITITLQSFPEETSIQWQTILMPSLQAQSMPIETTTQQNDGGDVLLTSIWLQNRLWHLALTHNLLVVNHTNPLLRFDYAFELADRAIDVLKLMRMSGFEGHGQGLVSMKSSPIKHTSQLTRLGRQMLFDCHRLSGHIDLASYQLWTNLHRTIGIKGRRIYIWRWYCNINQNQSWTKRS